MRGDWGEGEVSSLLFSRLPRSLSPSPIAPATQAILLKLYVLYYLHIVIAVYYYASQMSVVVQFQVKSLNLS